MGHIADNLWVEQPYRSEQDLSDEGAPLRSVNTSRIIAGTRRTSTTTAKKRPQSVGANLSLATRPSHSRPADIAWQPFPSLENFIHHKSRSSQSRDRKASRYVMIIGSPTRAQAIFERICVGGHTKRDIKEFLPDRCLLEPHGPALMSRIARQEHIDEIIIATSNPAIIQTAIREAERNQLDAYIAPDLTGANVISFERINGMPLLKVCEQHVPQHALLGKRILDIMLSVAGLIAMAPVLALIALAIKLESAGPMLYRAARVGRKGRRFACYKFRTMVPHADALKAGLRSQNQRAGAFFKITDDPRITRVGRFLRRYSLDELPQLWNVLCGNMSLVGPRPHPPDDVERYEIEDLRRLDFMPGITGLWQVTARQDPSFQRCVNLDVEYIESWSLSLDFRILWRTIGVVLQGTGA